jgi:hypothetical protein
MRREVVSLVFAGIVSAAPLLAAPGDVLPDETPAVAVQRVSGPSMGIRDEAAMLIVGTALIGLAAAVRRAA